jgi:hypothetical protein
MPLLTVRLDIALCMLHDPIKGAGKRFLLSCHGSPDEVWTVSKTVERLAKVGADEE